MLGIYLSGTGNTKHVMERFLGLMDPEAEILALTTSDEDKIVEKIRCNDHIVLAYPTQFSNAPYMVRDFINRNSRIWKGRKIFCITTMGAFSGDGTGCTARLLKKYGAMIMGGLQIKMPDSVCDSKLLKKSADKNAEIIRLADMKIEGAVRNIKDKSMYPKEGLGVISHLAGLFGQRLWFSGKTAGYSGKLKISDDCIGCGICAADCPMENLKIENGHAVSNDRCTMCYRCISTCPKQAVTLLGDKVYEQYRFDNYRKDD